MLLVVFCVTWPRPAHAEAGTLPTSALAWIGGAVLSLIVTQAGNVWSGQRGRVIAADDRRVELIETRLASQDVEIRRIERELRADIRAIENSIHGLRVDINALRQDGQRHDAEIRLLTESVDALRVDQGRQGLAVATLSANVDGMREEMTEMRATNTEILRHLQALSRAS